MPPLDTKPKRDWWKRGRAFDLWSIPHFLFGVLAGMVPQLFGISVTTALVLMAVLAIAWELYEKRIGIKETALNIAADFVLPVLAFTCTLFVLRLYPLYHDELLVFAVAVGAVYLFTNISGWLAYRRRHRDFIH